MLVEQIPSVPQSLFYKFDEFYLLLDLVVEYSHLKIYNCSFSELFYRLRRINENGSRLTRKQIVIGLLFLSVLPYLRQKLLASYLNQKEIQYRTITDKTLKQSILDFNYRLYPKAFAAIDLIGFVYRLTYASGLTNKHSLDLHYTKSLLTYQNPADLEGSTFSQILLNIFGFGISSGAFFMQFLDHWFIEQKSTSFFQVPFVDCPQKVVFGLQTLDKARSRKKIFSRIFVDCLTSYVFCLTKWFFTFQINPQMDKTLCSICSRPKTNPTVISVTG